MASAIGTVAITTGKWMLSTILQPLAAKAMDFMVDKGTAMANIKREICNLQTTLRMIQGIVQVAEEKQIDNVFIQNWLRDLVDIGYEARDVLDDFITFSSFIAADEASKPVNFISSLILSYIGASSSDTSNLPLAVLSQLEKDIRGVRERFDKKKKEGETFATFKSVIGGGGSESVPTNNTRPEVGPYLNRQGDNLFLGREEVKEGIMERLLHPSDDRVHVVPIWGMGGIGKTTLALSIYNDQRVKKDYPTKNRSWLYVGENKFSAEKVIREIVNDKKTTGIGNLQKKIEEELNGNRFLIVLDDVWDVDGSGWNLLFNPLTHVGKGGFIIITTRKSEVITATNTLVPDTLRPLSYQHSWSIFESHAFISGNSDSRPDLKCVGEKIVEKLKGLPLALEVVGRSLLNEDASTWKNFLNSKDDDVMSALRWSYNLLRPPHLKYCFAYCALFPKDHEFEEEALVEMWMAHDLIPKEDQKRPEDVGIQCFKQLLSASLLQSVDGKYVMHDMVHDLALLVSNGEFASANGSLSNDQMEKVRHITITHDYPENLRLCKSKRILTLYTMARMWWEASNRTNFNIDVILDDLKSTSIRVLVLSQEVITEIPDCIGELRHLRYLDVKQTGVKSLPESLCHLYHLQVLAAPPDAVLPKDIVNMVNLRHVRANLSTCTGVGKLTSLQELSSIRVCRDDNIRELGDMQLLRGKLTIKGLGNVEKLEDHVGVLMEKQTDIDRLILLFDKQLEKSTISAQVLDDLGCPPYLTYLKIYGYTGVKSPSWMVDGKYKFEKLQTLELSDCPKLDSLPPFGELNFLKDLSLQHLHGVKRLGYEFYGNLTKRNVFFPSLESLSFSYMNEWTEWDDITINNSNMSFFPRLTRLEICDCPKVVVVLPTVKTLKRKDKHPTMHQEGTEWDDITINNSSVSFFPRLTSLEIKECRCLTSLPPLGELTSLKRLSLRNVGVKRLGDEFYGNLTKRNVFFPSLESLCFVSMHEWTEWDDITIDNSSVSFFPRLTRLEIYSCRKLVLVLPTVMYAADFMTSLSSLEITECWCLTSLPPLGELTSLKHLSLSLVGVKRLGDEFYGNLTKRNAFFPSLESLRFDTMSEWTEWDDITINNSSMSFFPRLTRLEIYSCRKLVLVLPTVKTLKRKLRKDKHPITMSAANFMTSLSSLKISLCDGLKRLQLDALVSLKDLDISHCSSLVRITSSICLASTVERLQISDCEHLETMDFERLPSIKYLRLHTCKSLKALTVNVDGLDSLEDLTIVLCPVLELAFEEGSSSSSSSGKSMAVPLRICTDKKQIFTKLLQYKFVSLETLTITLFTKFENFIETEANNFCELKSLKILRISFFSDLQSLPANFHKLSSLISLKIDNCSKLQSLPRDFHKLSSLKRLKIISCELFHSLPPDFHKLSSLESLYISDCPQIQSLPENFHKLSSLKSLHIQRLPQIQSLPPNFHNLFSLKSLHIERCPRLQSLPENFHKLSSLEKLHIYDCPELRSLPDLGLPRSVESLKIKNCLLLFERCKRESDLDWHKIKHIHKITVIKHIRKITVIQHIHKITVIKHIPYRRDDDNDEDCDDNDNDEDCEDNANANDNDEDCEDNANDDDDDDEDLDDDDDDDDDEDLDDDDHDIIRIRYIDGVEVYSDYDDDDYYDDYDDKYADQ